MTTIPLVLDQDTEPGPLPNYEDVMKTKKNEFNARGTRSRRFLDIEFGKDALFAGSVALANISIRLGSFLLEFFYLLIYH